MSLYRFSHLSKNTCEGQFFIPKTAPVLILCGKPTNRAGSAATAARATATTGAATAAGGVACANICFDFHDLVLSKIWKSNPADQ
jgi:hypothetical protein